MCSPFYSARSTRSGLVWCRVTLQSLGHLTLGSAKFLSVTVSRISSLQSCISAKAISSLPSLAITVEFLMQSRKGVSESEEEVMGIRTPSKIQFSKVMSARERLQVQRCPKGMLKSFFILSNLQFLTRIFPGVLRILARRSQ